MTETEESRIMPEGSSKTEWKTKLGTTAAFLASGAAIGFLQTLDLSGLPQWAAAVGGAAVTAGITWLVQYNTAHKPDALSISAVRAFARR